MGLSEARSKSRRSARKAPQFAGGRRMAQEEPAGHVGVRFRKNQSTVFPDRAIGAQASYWTGGIKPSSRPPASLVVSGSENSRQACRSILRTRYETTSASTRSSPFWRAARFLRPTSARSASGSATPVSSRRVPCCGSPPMAVMARRVQCSPSSMPPAAHPRYASSRSGRPCPTPTPPSKRTDLSP